MGTSFALVLIVVSLVLSIIAVNKGYQIFMKMMGADVMFYSKKTRRIAIFIVFVLILGTLAKVFGLG